MGPCEGTGCAARGVRGARLGILPALELVGTPSLLDLIPGGRRSSALELQARSLDRGEGAADLLGCQPVQPSHWFHWFPSVSSRTGLVPRADSRVCWPLWASAVDSWGSHSPRKLWGGILATPRYHTWCFQEMNLPISLSRRLFYPLVPSPLTPPDISGLAHTVSPLLDDALLLGVLLQSTSWRAVPHPS